jgi:serine/threonine protein kinase
MPTMGQHPRHLLHPPPSRRGQSAWTLTLAAAPQGRVLSCLVGIARALQYLHKLDQYHGELSSATVLLHTPRGCMEAVPKLTALPTERMLPPQLGYQGSASRWEAEALLLPDSSIGYCCPEMLTGRDASPACDVYALGVLSEPRPPPLHSVLACCRRALRCGLLCKPPCGVVHG